MWKCYKIQNVSKSRTLLSPRILDKRPHWNIIQPLDAICVLRQHKYNLDCINEWAFGKRSKHAPHYKQ